MRGERLLTFKQASEWLQREMGLKRGKHTLDSWFRHGSGGVRLECVVVGGRLFTSAEAIRRFISNTTRRHAAEAGMAPAELKL